MKKLIFLACYVAVSLNLNAMWSNPDFFSFALEYYKTQTQEEQQNHNVIPEPDSESATTESVISDEEALVILDSFN
ncbi:hypothetical protein Noda2021_08580 [Candidatus Dependentiae bacterium Noda2021]|nr:hypothetical protein Noda2021_08580 [Candidatus Dependentiae bacterium Noda2021]